MSASPYQLATRRPRRVSVTMPDSTYRSLLRLSDDQGRSLSNLSSYLLEQAVDRLLKEEQQRAGANGHQWSSGTHR